MDHLQQLISRYPVLSGSANDIMSAFDIIRNSYEAGGKLLIAGNGGSASDSEHMVGELMKSFLKKRRLPDEIKNELDKIDLNASEYLIPRLQSALPAIALSAHTSLSTASINDIHGNIMFAQQVLGYGKKEDVLLGISTSGNSQNIIYAAIIAKAKKIKVIGLTGDSGGELKKYCDVCIKVPEVETYKIQELHIPVYHTLCIMLEDHFFKS